MNDRPRKRSGRRASGLPHMQGRTYTLPLEIIHWVDRQAEARGVTGSAVVRELLKRELAAEGAP